MMSTLKHIIIVLTCLLSYGVYCDVQFEFDTEQCLGQLVEYQCTVTGVSPLRWRIVVDGSLIGTTVTYNDFSDPESDATVGEGEFMVERLDNSPIISNISFTVQSSINGYTIQCIGGEETEQFNITIPGIPGAPDNVTVNSSTFTSSSVDIYWTESLSSSSMCFAGYNYTVSSAALDNSIIMNVADSTSTTLNNLVPSFADLYTVEVVAVDLADRSSNESSAQFLFSAPPTVANLEVFNETETDTTVDVTVMWEESNFNVASDVAVPPLMGYKLTLINSTDPSDYSNQSDLLPLGTTEYVFYGAPKGRTYNATVTAINSVGMNSTSELYDAPGPFIDIRPPPTSTRSPTSRTTTATSTRTRSSTTTTSTTTRRSRSSTTTSTRGPSESNPTSERVTDNNIGPIVGGVVGGVIFLLILVVVILIPVAYFVCIKNRESVDLGGNKRTGVTVSELAEKDPEIGDSFYDNKKHADSSVSPDQPDGNGQAELATYQDPKTIERKEAPTGDMYAVPEKKPLTTDTSATVQTYAELDLPNKQKQDQSPSGEPPVVVNLGTQQPVMYSELRNL